MKDKYTVQIYHIHTHTRTDARTHTDRQTDTHAVPMHTHKDAAHTMHTPYAHAHITTYTYYTHAHTTCTLSMWTCTRHYTYCTHTCTHTHTHTHTHTRTHICTHMHASKAKNMVAVQNTATTAQ